ncbi:hypothetical protein PUNSTDRAFT_139706 [Punctularia strigosozonata HHB-11173 SS5]|uniref:Uncharacterized protein n=1 Tax=Punctularia strigosozonata (strain HHB-11173) TaxID=741275 RepID=R7RZ67_PUNST|nr:uncharacterized protein PUNSTDRAFT_139706 [Punctularia strigosozonata HHB-11173 SS5]EIN03268.1 hypothetical protein PUNSTDRAFT_139706 [Punctularia strigosozonata HHB-11173 SS5]
MYLQGGVSSATFFTKPSPPPRTTILISGAITHPDALYARSRMVRPGRWKMRAPGQRVGETQHVRRGMYIWTIDGVNRTDMTGRVKKVIAVSNRFVVYELDGSTQSYEDGMVISVRSRLVVPWQSSDVKLWEWRWLKWRGHFWGSLDIGRDMWEP